MSTCFLYGSEKDQKGNPCLDLPITIEYLQFDFDRQIGNVQIVNDFFISNPMPEEQKFLCIHRGKVNFKCFCGSWYEDKEYTGMLSALAGREIGLNLKNKGQIMLLGNVYSHLKDSKNSETVVDFGENKNFDNVPFTFIKTPVIPPNKRVVFRIKGTLEQKPFKHLLKDYFNSGVLRITGGKPLIDDIGEDCKKEEYSDSYMTRLESFVNKKMILPGFFHVFAGEKRKGDSILDTIISPFRRQRKLSCFGLSSDVLPGRENLVYKNKRLNWYWSDAAFFFSQYSNARGPVLEMHRS